MLLLDCFWCGLIKALDISISKKLEENTMAYTIVPVTKNDYAYIDFAELEAACLVDEGSTIGM